VRGGWRWAGWGGPGRRARCAPGWPPTGPAGWTGWRSDRGATAAFPPSDGAALVELTRQAPEARGLPRTRWRLRDLRDALPALAGYSLAGICRALTRLGIGRQRGHFRHRSPDPQYREKLAAVEAARARAAGGAAALLFGDEFSLYRQPTLGPAYCPPGAPPAAPRSARSDTYYRYAGALDAATGRVTWLGRSRMGVEGLRRFLARLRRAYADRPLILVWDNWPVHRHAEVLATAAALDIELVWLPTYAPWTNPIEKLWRWLAEDLLRHHTKADAFAALQAQVAAWLDQFAVDSPALLRYVGLAPGEQDRRRRARRHQRKMVRLSC
jgi:transposase